MSFTHVVMEGRLTRDPELRYSADGKAFCKVGIAVNQGWGDRKKAHFFDWTLFGKSGESVEKHFRKGDPIVLVGQAELDEFETRDGQKRSKVCFTGRDWHFTDSKSRTEEEHPTNTGVRSEPQHTEEVSQADRGPLTDDEVPF